MTESNGRSEPVPWWVIVTRAIAIGGWPVMLTFDLAVLSDHKQLTSNPLDGLALASVVAASVVALAHWVRAGIIATLHDRDGDAYAEGYVRGLAAAKPIAVVPPMRRP